MNSVFFRGTGRQLEPNQTARDLPSNQTARGGEIFEAQFLRDTRGRNLVRDDGTVDARLNAAGDTVDTATGYQIVTDTLTYLTNQVSKQKFFTVAPADFMPVMVGEGAFASQLLFNRSYSTSEDFEAGIIRAGNGDARLTTADAAVDGLTQLTNFWAKEINYNIIEVQQALVANSWDSIQGKMEARKTNWDLGIQITAFLGLATDSRYPGLLTNSAWNVNTAIIVKYISSMTAAEFATFMAAFIPAYVTNVGSTAMPDTLIMPQADYLACAALMVQNLLSGGTGTYVGMNILDYMLMSFKRQTGNQNFKILPLYYADKTVNNGLRALNKNYYALYRSDPKSVRMNIPIDYTVLQSGTLNNFQFHAAAYGQFTGVAAIRALETLIFTF